MKIAYVSNSILPSRTANSVHVMKMCQSLGNEGYSVTLYAPNRPGIEKNINDIYKFYDVKENFKIKKLPWKNFKGRAYIYGYQVAEEIKKERPDIIYGRFLLGCFFSSLKNKKSKIIFEAHKPLESDGYIQHVLFKKLLKKKNYYKTVVITNALKKHFMKKYNIKENDIIVAPDGADFPQNKVVPAKLKLESDKFNIGYVGSLYQGKGMEIISELVRKCSWANFHIIGGTEKDIRFWRDQLEGLNNIHFYGFVPHSETVKYIKACDVLIAPYQKKVQGAGKKGSNLSQWMSPLKLFEYMSMKKAIIASDLPVLREILINESNSILCNPYNIKEWIDALKKLSEDKGLREFIAENAYNDFVENYTWDSRTENIIGKKKDK